MAWLIFIIILFVAFWWFSTEERSKIYEIWRKEDNEKKKDKITS